MPFFKGLKSLFLVALTISLVGCSMFGVRDYETPQYQVLHKQGKKEIRAYDAYIVAKTTVKGGFKESQGKAFRILASYIFGDNQRRQKISMTGPVVQKSAVSEKISMTGPVVQQPDSEGWVMTFMMPAKYTLDSLPIPNDDRIRFEQVPAKKMAVIQYSWLASEEKNLEQANLLQDWLDGQGEYQSVSLPFYAGYDPPWTLPFLRRHEMMIEVFIP